MTSPRHCAQFRTGDRVVIIGAGPAGLTAGYLLTQKGCRVTLLEGEAQVGGISRTVRFEDYRMDVGGHRFFTKYAPVQRLWEEILGEDFLSVSRLSRIHYRDRFFNYPLKAGNALRGLGAVNAAIIVASYLRACLFPRPQARTFEDWVSNRFGRRLYEIFFKTYTEKVWGIPCSQISAEWAAQRIQGLSLGHAIRHAIWPRQKSNRIKSLIERFHYPRRGPGQMWEACAEKIVAMGGEVRLRHRVTLVEVDDDRVRAVCAETPDSVQRFEADHVISTTDLAGLVQAIRPEAPDDLLRAARGLRYRDFLTVGLVIDSENLFPDNWIYVHTPGVAIGRIQNFGNWSADMVPVPGKTFLGLEYFCFEGDPLWSKTDPELIALAAHELAQLGLADAALVSAGTVVRQLKAYPIYDSEHRAHLAKIRIHLDTLKNLHTIGRNGMHKYNNQDHSMMTAIMAVENMFGAAHDLWSVNTDAEYHEEQRAEAAA